MYISQCFPAGGAERGGGERDKPEGMTSCSEEIMRISALLLIYGLY